MEHEALQAFFFEGGRRLLAEQTAEEVLEWAQRQLARFGIGGEQVHMLDIPQSIEFHNALLDKRAAELALPPGQRKVLEFPWDSWNRMIDPMPGGMLMTLAGADGAGKTIYAECMAEWFARKGHKVAYYHFELGHSIMMDRRMARWSQLSVRELKQALSPEQRGRVERANSHIMKWSGNITYVHCPGWSMEKVVGSMHALRGDDLADVVIVDYLEKASASVRQTKLFGTNVWQREADNVEALKNCAEMLEVPVVMVAQLNKANKSGDARDLDRTGIRGAGEKTEKANVVVLLHRERNEETGDYSPIVNIRLDKNTLGPTGSWEQMLRPEHFTVLDVIKERVELNG